MSQEVHPSSADDSKSYFERHQLNRVLEAIVAGLSFNQPSDPLAYIESCVQEIRKKNFLSPGAKLTWDYFMNDNDARPGSDRTKRLLDKPKATGPLYGPVQFEKPMKPPKASTLEPFKSLPPIPVSAKEVAGSSSHHTKGPLPAIGAQPVDPAVLSRPAWKNIVFVLGGPGCGKGTMCTRLKEEFHYVHLSAGDLLRAEVAKGNESGKELEALMKEGKIVPAETTLRLMRSALENAAPDASGFLVDGFPRKMDQALEFEEKISSVGEPDEVYKLTRAHFLPKIDDSDINSSRRVLNPNIILVLGGPGSGKGTQCEKLVKEFGLAHLSTGDLLREEVAKGSTFGKELQEIMKVGGLVSTVVVLRLLKSAMLEKEDAPGFLIDGFPRALDQAQEFERVVGDCRSCLYFECGLETLEARLIERGKTSGRSDDNMETIRLRFKTFQEQSMPVVEYFEKQGKVNRISSEAPVDEVYEKTRKQVDEILRPFKDSNIVFVLGGPGSGKGTQCEQIVSKLGFAHLSTGDLLRAEVAKGTPLGKDIEAIMKDGKMVDLSVTKRLLINAMAEAQSSGARGFLVDGFPRTIEQASVFEKAIGHPKFVLFFDVPSEILVERLLKRGETSGRADDNAESIKKRIETFVQTSMPVVQHYEGQNLVRKISGTGEIDEITAATMAAFAEADIMPLEDTEVLDTNGTEVPEAKTALNDGWRRERALARKKEEEEDADNDTGDQANGNGLHTVDDTEWEDVEPEGEGDLAEDGYEPFLEVRFAPSDVSQRGLSLSYFNAMDSVPILFQNLLAVDPLWQALSTAASAQPSTNSGNAFDNSDPGDAFISADDPAFANMDPSGWFFTAEGAESLTEEGRRRLEEMEDALEPPPTTRFHPYANRRGRREDAGANGQSALVGQSNPEHGEEDPMEETP
ncbi:hypothetical protein HDU93_002736 [Gonapodya sp. JEL0774]|nr:hypothetical protein HDU93_002736 [Gonapodya sp. JEL0774]